MGQRNETNFLLRIVLHEQLPSKIQYAYLKTSYKKFNGATSTLYKLKIYGK